MQIAFNYSGRDELVNAIKKISSAAKSGDIDPLAIDEQIINSNLFTAGIPEPDLLIRTGGDRRISNFLLYHLAYTEIQFSKTLWPDFTEGEFVKCLEVFSKTERRFGKRTL